MPTNAGTTLRCPFRGGTGDTEGITEGTGQQRNLCNIHVSRLIKLLRNSAITNRASRELGRLPRFVFRSGLGTPQNFVLTFPPQPAFYLQFTLTRTLRRRENQSSRFAPSWNARGGTRACRHPELRPRSDDMHVLIHSVITSRSDLFSGGASHARAIMSRAPVESLPHTPASEVLL
jgi:hypothetical protein